MLKWLTILLVVFIGVMLTVSYLYGVALRNAGLIEGRLMLKVAAKDFQQFGYVTNVSSSSYRFWLSTNVVTIGGTRYQCYAEVGGGKFYDEGTLAITTNQTFIWLDSKRPPKIITANYRAPIFPPHF
jgi:hypothetical protein